MDLAKTPDISCNLQNPPGRKFRVRKRGHVRENKDVWEPWSLTEINPCNRIREAGSRFRFILGERSDRDVPW